VLGGASAAATVMGLLLLPMAAAQAEGACPTGATGTISLSADCTLTGTWVVPSGSTIDGNGHTITADAGTYDGAVIRSTTPGTSGQPATTMTVGHVTINAAAVSDDSVIVFDGSKGRVNQVLITGGQGSASDTGFGVEVENTQQALFGATDQVKIDSGTSIHGYQQAAVHITDGVRFTVLRSIIGNPNVGSGTSASGILVDGLAHGAITENTITLSGAEPAADATDFRAGVTVDHTLRVEIKRNVFSGNDADFGVAALNTLASAKTTAAVDCNLFRRNDTRTAGNDPFGAAVARFSTDTHLVNVTLTNSTVEGNWNRTSGTVSGTTVTAGVPNTTTGHCAPTAPGNVVAKGGDGRSKVTWKAARAPGAWAPLTGYKVTAKTAGRPAVVKNVAANATSAQLTGLKNGHAYKVTVSAENNSGHTNGTAKLAATKLSLSGTGAVRHGGTAHLSGTLKSSDPQTHVSKRTIEIWAKPKGGKWTKIGTVKTTGGGHFSKSVKPKKTTTYKAVYAGHPGLASSHKTTVVVRG
jgi:hypothetical protein